MLSRLQIFFLCSSLAALSGCPEVPVKVSYKNTEITMEGAIRQASLELTKIEDEFKLVAKGKPKCIAEFHGRIFNADNQLNEKIELLENTNVLSDCAGVSYPMAHKIKTAIGNIHMIKVISEAVDPAKDSECKKKFRDVNNTKVTHFYLAVSHYSLNYDFPQTLVYMNLENETIKHDLTTAELGSLVHAGKIKAIGTVHAQPRGFVGNIGIQMNEAAINEIHKRVLSGNFTLILVADRIPFVRSLNNQEFLVKPVGTISTQPVLETTMHLSLANAGCATEF